MTKTILPVAAALVVRDGEVLIAQRLPGAANGSLWELPGGKVDFGEHPSQSLVREMHEELGMQVTVQGLYGVFSHVYEEHLQVLLMVYRCLPGPLEPRSIECQAFKYVNPQKALAFDLAPLDREIVTQLAKDPTIC